MNLTDREILELSELCNAVVDGRLTEQQRTRLTTWLKDSEAAREYYVKALGQSASLYSYASEMQSEAPDSFARQTRRVRFLKWSGFLATAALVMLVLWLRNGLEKPEATLRSAKLEPFVARLTGSRECTWDKAAMSFSPGDRIRRGQRLELAAGRAEVTFDSGARVTLVGPVSLDVGSAWDSTLRHGTVLANVPPEAIGFRVSNPSVEVMDLGTEFTMIADASGAADVLVLKGEVEAAPRKGDDQQTIRLKATEARRFAETGVSDVLDRDMKFAESRTTVSLDRFSAAINYVHWSFDETEGDTLAANSVGAGFIGKDSKLTLVDADDSSTLHPLSPHGHALQFDGKLQASGQVPGISGSTSRTVAFWVRVPKEAKTDAWMVSWGTTLKKLDSRPVQISWNRRPGDGAFGALRTDFGGGYAIGAQDLRDGNWHHIAVFFSPGEGPNPPVQVKQYIDGRLESSTIALTPGTVRQAAAVTGGTDVVWLGYRLTGKQPEHFRGEIDELFIADRALEPDEVVSLMNDNRLPASNLVSVP